MTIDLSFRCDKQWDDLCGDDDRRRHCADCDQHVYNLSGMTRAAAGRFLREHDAGICVHFVTRDGRIVHDGDPLEQLRAQRRGARTLIALSLAASAAILSLTDDPAELLFDPFYAIADILKPEPVEREEHFMGNMAVTSEVTF